jgi:PEP-CTERM motif-containing protein
MTSLRTRRLARMSLLLLCCACQAAKASAEPLLFDGTHFVINSLPERLDLFSNPGAILEPRTYGGVFFPPALLFGAFLTHDGGESFTDIIRFTYHEGAAAPVVFSQTFTTGTDPVRLGFNALFTPTRQTGTPILSTLTVDLLNSAPDFMIPSGPDQGRLVDSFTYSFFTQTPVPEPSTWLLMVSGGIAALLAGRRRLSSE